MSAIQPCFTLDKTISAGKSTLILVNCTKDSKNYVLKIFSDDKASVQAFTHEEEILSKLSHPNIIKSYSNDLLSISKDEFQYNVITMEHAPYGNFLDIMMRTSFNHNEKLIRTFFHHLVEGIQYLHTQQLAHFDLKLENLLLGEDFMLKIADFDLAKKLNEESLILRGGSENYRAPEVLSKTCHEFSAADVYSAAVCLYTLMTGSFPFIEEEENGQKVLFRYDVYMNDNNSFWTENQALMGGKVHFSESFKELLNKMWVKNPRERATLEDIKNSKWYNEPIYNEQELKIEAQKVLGPEALMNEADHKLI